LRTRPPPAAHTAPTGGQRDKDQVIAIFEGLLAELNRDRQHQPDRRRRNALKHGGDHRFLAVEAIGHPHLEHDQPARQTDGDNRNQSAGNAAQAISHQNRHVSGIEAGQRLAD